MDMLVQEEVTNAVVAPDAAAAQLDTPRVSVVIPSYNRGHTIVACLQSVLTQTFQDFEIIVVDDASADDTKARVASVEDPRIQYIAHAQNWGGAAARNTGIRAARGEFIAFLDSDDTWAPEKLAQQLACIESRGPDYGVVYTWFIGRDNEGQEVSRSNHTLDGWAFESLLVANYVGTFSSILVRRSVIEGVGGLDESLRSCQDWDLSIRLSRVTKICCVEDYLVSYLHNGKDKHRISSNPKSLIQGHRRVLEKFEDDYSRLPREKAVQALNGFLMVFSSAGSFPDVFRLGRRIVAAAPDVRGLGLCFSALARTAKRRMTRRFGY